MGAREMLSNVCHEGQSTVNRELPTGKEAEKKKGERKKGEKNLGKGIGRRKEKRVRRENGIIG